jgi:N-acetylglucosaminyl-diphospho-decaprenol L-rhamnosyltransferase
VVDPGGNLGYAGGANRGIAATSTPVVAVCNPDLHVRAGTGAALLARLEAPGVAAAGPRIRNPDGSTYPSARSVPSHVDAVGHGLLGLLWPANPFSTRYRQLDADPDVAREVDWVSGAAIWLRRDALDAIGGWDDGYFMYVEDVDLCWRLGRAGWRIAYEPRGEVVHAQGLSTDAKPYRMIVEHHRSLLRFASKRWRGPRRLLLGPAAVYLAFRTALAMAVRALRPRSGKPRVRG